VSGERAAHLWNIAADAEINDDLLAADVTLPRQAVTPQGLGLPTARSGKGRAENLLARRQPRP
jgi:hypothetical protein